MRRCRTLVFAALFLTMLFILSSDVYADNIKPKIAFLIFSPLNMEASSLMETLPSSLTIAVGRTGYFEQVERRKVEKEIELSGFKLTNIQVSELLKISGRLGLDFCVFGDVQKERGVITSHIKVLDIRAQRVVFEHTLTSSEGKLNEKINEAAYIISKKALQFFSSSYESVKAEEVSDKQLKPPYLVEAVSGTKKIRVKWKYDVQDIIGFKVYRALKNDSPSYTMLGVASDMFFVDDNPTMNEPLLYRVAAVNKKGIEGEFSESVVAQTVVGPPPPIFLCVNANIKSAVLKWRERPGSSVAGFRIYRKADGEKDYKEVAVVSAETNTYTDRGLKDASLYSYEITALDASKAESESSKTLEVTTLKPVESVKTEGGKIRKVPMEWTVHAPEVVEGYKIYRATDSAGEYKSIASVRGRLANKYIDTSGLEDAETYWYKISSYNADGVETDMSASSPAVTRGKPPVPRGIKASNREPRRVSLQWAQIKSPEDEIRGYYVFRASEKDGEYKKIADLDSPNDNSYVDKSPPLKDNTTYYYKIASYNSAGAVSSLSEPVSSVTKNIPAVPSGLKAKSGEVKRVSLSWEPNPEKDIKVYVIYRCLASEKEFDKIATVKDKSEYADTDLKDGTKYVYAIDAVDKDNLVSTRSASVTAATKPLPSRPAGVKVSDINGKKALQWEKNPESDVSRYNVYKKGFLGISQKITTVQDTSWIADEIKGKAELFVTALDNTELESEHSETIVIEKKQ